MDDVIQSVDYAIHWLSKPPPIDPPENDHYPSHRTHIDLTSPGSSDEEEDEDLFDVIAESLSDMTLSEDVENWLATTGLGDVISPSCGRPRVDPDGGEGRPVEPERRSAPLRVQNDVDEQSMPRGSYRKTAQRESAKWGEAFSPTNDKWSQTNSPIQGRCVGSAERTPTHVDIGVHQSIYEDQREPFSPLLLKQDSGILDEHDSSSSSSGEDLHQNLPKKTPAQLDLEKALSKLAENTRNMYRGKYSSRERKRRMPHEEGNLHLSNILSHSFSSGAFEEDTEPELLPERKRVVRFSPHVQVRYIERYQRSAEDGESGGGESLSGWECGCGSTSMPSEANFLYNDNFFRWRKLRRLFWALKEPGITAEEEDRIRNEVKSLIQRPVSDGVKSAPKGPEQIEVIHVEEDFGDSNYFFRFGDPGGVLFVSPSVENGLHSSKPWWTRDQWRIVSSDEESDERNSIDRSRSSARDQSSETNGPSNSFSDPVISLIDRSSMPSHEGFLTVASATHVTPVIDLCDHLEDTTVEYPPMKDSGRRSSKDISEPPMVVFDRHSPTKAVSRKTDARRNVVSHPSSSMNSLHEREGGFMRAKNVNKEQSVRNNFPTAAVARTPVKPEQEIAEQISGAGDTFGAVLESFSNELDTVAKSVKTLTSRWDSAFYRGIGSLLGDSTEQKVDKRQPLPLAAVEEPVPSDPVADTVDEDLLLSRHQNDTRAVKVVEKTKKMDDKSNVFSRRPSRIPSLLSSKTPSAFSSLETANRPRSVPNSTGLSERRIDLIRRKARLKARLNSRERVFPERTPSCDKTQQYRYRPQTSKMGGIATQFPKRESLYSSLRQGSFPEFSRRDIYGRDMAFSGSMIANDLTDGFSDWRPSAHQSLVSPESTRSVGSLSASKYDSMRGKHARVTEYPYSDTYLRSSAGAMRATKIRSLRESVRNAKDRLETTLTSMAAGSETADEKFEGSIRESSAGAIDGAGVVLFKPTINVYGDSPSGIDTAKSFLESPLRSIPTTSKKTTHEADESKGHTPPKPETIRSELLGKDLEKHFEETDSVLSQFLNLPKSPRRNWVEETAFDDEDGLTEELRELAESERMLREELESIHGREAAIRWKFDAWNFHQSRVPPSHSCRIIDLSNVHEEEEEDGKSTLANQSNHGNPSCGASILIPNLEYDAPPDRGIELVYMDESSISVGSVSFGSTNTESFQVFVVGGSDSLAAESQSDLSESCAEQVPPDFRLVSSSAKQSGRRKPLLPNSSGRIRDRLPWGRVEELYLRKAAPRVYPQNPVKGDRSGSDCSLLRVSSASENSGSAWKSSSDEEVNSLSAPPPNLYVAIEPVSLPYSLKKKGLPKRKQSGPDAGFSSESLAVELEVGDEIEKISGSTVPISSETNKVNTMRQANSSVSSKSFIDSVASSDAEQRLLDLGLKAPKQDDGSRAGSDSDDLVTSSALLNSNTASASTSMWTSGPSIDSHGREGVASAVPTDFSCLRDPHQETEVAIPGVKRARRRRRFTRGMYTNLQKHPTENQPHRSHPTLDLKAGARYTPRLLRKKPGWKNLKSSLPVTARMRHLASAVPGSLLWEAAANE